LTVGDPSSASECVNARETEERCALHVYPQRGITLVRGDGAEVEDDQGRRYIDCVGGIGTANVGHANPEVARAVAEQARTLTVCPGIFHNDRRARLLEKLTSLAPDGLTRAFLCNSGAEAVEAAIKFARLATGRMRVVAAVRGFHGRTMGALSATFNKKYREPFAPLVPGVSFVPFDDAAKLRAAVLAVGEADGGVAAVLLEPVQGEGGVRLPGRGYLQAVRETCDEAGALMILDEVQTGFCRTGRMFACEHYGVTPDLLCLAKAVGGGLPLGAVLANDRVPPATSLHGTTSAGSPLACAAALAAIRFMEEHDLAGRARSLGAFFRERFSDPLPRRVRSVRQIGLMIGIELRERCRPYLDALARRGVLALPAGAAVIRLLPPLVVSEQQMAQVAEALTETLEVDTGLP